MANKERWHSKGNPMREPTGDEKIVGVKGNGTGQIIDVRFSNGESVRIETDLLYTMCRSHLANFLAGDVDGHWLIKATWRKDDGKK